MFCKYWGIYAKYKYDVEFINFVSEYDIFGMCQTWASSGTDFDNFMPDYDHFDFVRKKDHKGC